MMTIDKVLKLEINSGNIPLHESQLSDSASVTNIEYHGSRRGQYSWILTIQGRVSDDQYYYPYTVVVLILTDQNVTLSSLQQDQLSFLINHSLTNFKEFKKVLLSAIKLLNQVVTSV